MKTIADLRTLVLAVIQTFVTPPRNFSAHDITNTLRDGITNGLYEIDGFPYEDINGTNTQRVEHEDVRDLVRTLVASGDVTTHTPVFNGSYTLYESAAGGSATLDTTDDDKATPPQPYPSSPLQVNITPTGKTYDLSSRKLQHRFYVRPGVQVTVTLPENLTSAEAKRLASFVQQLPYND